MGFELTIALRYLKATRHGLFAFVTTLIAIGGVTLGVASLIITLSVMNGFKSDIQEKTLGIQPHILLLVNEKTSPLTLPSVQDQIKNVKGVVSSSPFALGQVLLKSSRMTQGVVLRGILPDSEFKVTNVEKSLISGSWKSLESNEGNAPTLILGKELARNLGATLGTEILAFSSSENAPLGAYGSIPKIVRYQVGGIFQSGMYEFDANMALTSLKDAENTLGQAGSLGLGIRTDNLENAEKIASKVAELAGPKFWARSWQSMNKSLFDALKLEKVVMAIILTMIILVASFTIISNLILMSIEKTKEIGILKALGASQSSIRKIFLQAGIILGFTGTFLGTFFGIFAVFILGKTGWIKLPQDVYYIDTLPVKLSGLDISIVLAASMMITVLSSIYPASRAAKVNPVEAIRYG